MRTIRIATIFALLFAPALASAADQPASMGIAAPGAAEMTCHDTGVLGRIKQRFAATERSQWHRGFVIETIGNPRPSGHPYAEPGLVKRDYCVADSIMSNGVAYPVYYAIEHGLGFVGVGRNVDFCVPGLDRWHVHDGDCRTVR